MAERAIEILFYFNLNYGYTAHSVDGRKLFDDKKHSQPQFLQAKRTAKHLKSQFRSYQLTPTFLFRKITSLMQ